MSTQVNANLLKNFIIKKIGTELSSNEARKLKIEDEYKVAAEELDTENIEIQDLLDTDDLYKQFATLYVNEKEQKTEAKDKEEEKKEQTTIKDKNQAGV